MSGEIQPLAASFFSASDRRFLHPPQGLRLHDGPHGPPLHQSLRKFRRQGAMRSCVGSSTALCASLHSAQRNTPSFQGAHGGGAALASWTPQRHDRSWRKKRGTRAGCGAMGGASTRFYPEMVPSGREAAINTTKHGDMTHMNNVQNAATT